MIRKICSYCSKELPTPESCTCRTIKYRPRTVPRIRFGREENSWCTERCADCGVLLGGYHHANCSHEICPMCGDQVLLCSCESDFVF